MGRTSFLLHIIKKLLSYLNAASLKVEGVVVEDEFTLEGHFVRSGVDQRIRFAAEPRLVVDHALRGKGAFA